MTYSMSECNMLRLSIIRVIPFFNLVYEKSFCFYKMKNTIMQACVTFTITLCENQIEDDD